MFRRLISNISFSPALVGQLGFYARRIQKEESVRRVGLIFTALALVIQSFAVFSPPEPANAANSGDLVYGGLHTKGELLQAYDSNKSGIRELFQHANITRANLAAATEGEVHSRVNGQDAGWLSWNRTARFGLQNGETPLQVGNQSLFVRPLAAFDTNNNTKGSGSWYPSFNGKTDDGKEFSFMKACANILLKYRPPSTPPAYECTNIAATLNPGTRDQYTFKVASAAKNGATVYDYVINYGDGTPTALSKTDTFSHTYATPGTYSIKSSVRFTINGVVELKTRPECNTTITIAKETPPSPSPAASCINLQHKLITRTKFNLLASGEAKNGATIQAVKFTIKNESGKEVASRTVKTTQPSAEAEFDLTAAGNYTATATYATSLGEKTNPDCQIPFAIKKVEPCPVNPGLPINSPECQPCPGDSELWYKDDMCKAKILRTKSAQNITHDKDAQTIVAKGDDRITYTLSVKNEGLISSPFTIEDDLSDVLEYATVQNTGGGTFDKETSKLTWPEVTLQPGQSQTRMYTVKLPKTIPAAPQGISDPSSYDCRMTNVFGTTVDIKVDCPSPKVVEQTVSQLPHTGPRENIIFAGIVFAVVAYFYARSRQLKTEVRLIRRSVNAGTI